MLSQTSIGADKVRRPRVDRWPSLMASTIRRHQSLPFQWGVSDCGVMASDCVRAITGFNPTAGIRYATMAGALRAFREHGCGTALGLVESLFEEIDPADAMRGDLGFAAEVDALMSPAIIDGSLAFSKAESGPIILPRTLIVRAFAV